MFKSLLQGIKHSLARLPFSGKPYSEAPRVTLQATWVPCSPRWTQADVARCVALRGQNSRVVCGTGVVGRLKTHGVMLQALSTDFWLDMSCFLCGG